MAVKTKDQLKALFENGDTPTATEFIDLIDSFMHISDDLIVHDNELVCDEEDEVTFS